VVVLAKVPDWCRLGRQPSAGLLCSEIPEGLAGKNLAGPFLYIPLLVIARFMRAIQFPSKRKMDHPDKPGDDKSAEAKLNFNSTSRPQIEKGAKTRIQLSRFSANTDEPHGIYAAFGAASAILAS
jgi:hypothetical protein